MEQAIVDSNKETQDVIKDQFNSCRPSVNLISAITPGLYNLETKQLGSTSSTIYYSSAILDLKSGTYTLSSNTKFSIVRAFTDYDNSTNVIFGGNQSDLNSYTFTLTSDTKLYLSWRRTDGTDWSSSDKIQLQEGSIATEYEPYGEEICTNKLDEQNETSKGIWETLKSIPNLILDGIKGLFVPSEDELQSLIDEFKSTMETKLGAIYQVTDMLVDVFKSIFSPTERNSCITFPEIKDPMFDKLLIEQTDYCFDTLRTDFDFLFTISDMIISIVCTLSFGNMLYKKFEAFIGGDTSDY